jgi:hydroxymethylbilane synthase
VTNELRIASRGSDLALWQARAVAGGLRARHPELDVSVVVVKTTGDRILDVPLAHIGDRGLFTKELDSVVLAGDAELAVHSLKDLPTRLPAGLSLAAITEREDPRDVLLCRAGLGPALAELPAGARVGTSSLRRRAQLLAARPALEVVDLRGNLNTRLARLDSGRYDAVLLAAAGVLRLGWRERISAWLDPPAWLPAVGQGALAIVTRTEATVVREHVAALNHPPTAACVKAERAFLRAVEGGCQIPVGALATLRRGTLQLNAMISSLDGSTILRAEQSAAADQAEQLGRRVAGSLLAQGGHDILAGIRRAPLGSVPGVAAP